MNEEKIIQNQISRCLELNKLVFDTTYDAMLQNPEIVSINVRAVACELSGEDRVLASWIPAPLVPYVNKDTWTTLLSVTPSGIKYLSTADGRLSFECRIAGTVTYISMPLDGVMEMIGLNAKREIIDSQLFMCIVHDSEHLAPKPKPKLSIVQ